MKFIVLVSLMLVVVVTCRPSIPTFAPGKNFAIFRSLYINQSLTAIQLFLLLLFRFNEMRVMLENIFYLMM